MFVSSRHLVAGLVTASVLFAAACGGDDGGGSSTSAAASTTAASAPDTTAAGAPDTTSASTTSTGGDTTAPASTAPVGELTDSWQGVTAETIKIGLAAPDPEELKGYGIESEGPSAEQMFRAWIAAINADGGVLGRQLELAYTPFLPIGDAQADAACTALTEDAEVFAAIGIFTGDSVLCFTETHETPYVGIFGQTAERDARSTAPFIAIEMAEDRQRIEAVRSFIDNGDLEGRTIGLYTEAHDKTVTDDAIKPLLEEAGIDIATSVAADDFGDDQAAQDQALDVIVERFRADGVDTILNVSDFGPLAAALQRNGWLPDALLSTSAQSISAGYREQFGISPETMAVAEVAAPYTGDKAALLADPRVLECIDVYNASGPETPVAADELTGETLNGIGYYCAALQVFVDAATAAGADLTPTTFGAGAESLGELQLPGIPFGSLGPDKHSVGDTIGRYRYEEASDSLVLDGDPIHAG